MSAAAASAAAPAVPEKEPDLKIILLGDSAVGKSKLVERFLMNDYVPRQMSTYALTVFRHQQKTEDGKEIEVDFWVSPTTTAVARAAACSLVTHTQLNCSLSCASGHCRAGTLQFDAPLLLLPRARVHPCVRRDAKGDVPAPAGVVQRAAAVPTWSAHARRREQDRRYDARARVHTTRQTHGCRQGRDLTSTPSSRFVCPFRLLLPLLLLPSVDMSVTKQSFKFPLKNPACHPNVYFCSASDGSNVVKVFQTCIEAARAYKADPNVSDFQESVLETLDYFDQKEKQEAAAAAAPPAATATK